MSIFCVLGWGLRPQTPGEGAAAQLTVFCIFRKICTPYEQASSSVNVTSDIKSTGSHKENLSPLPTPSLSAIPINGGLSNECGMIFEGENASMSPLISYLETNQPGTQPSADGGTTGMTITETPSGALRSPMQHWSDRRTQVKRRLHELFQQIEDLLSQAPIETFV